MGHWWQNWLYIELFCSCGFVFHFYPIDIIILKHDLLLGGSSRICKLMLSCQFSGTIWMSCFLTEKFLKDFWLRSLLWTATWKQKLFSALTPSGLFRGRARSRLVWDCFSLPQVQALGIPIVCTLVESWLNVRLRKKVCSALLSGLFLDAGARQKANLCIYSTGVWCSMSFKYWFVNDRYHYCVLIIC